MGRGDAERQLLLGQTGRERGQHRRQLILRDVLVGGAWPGQHVRRGEHQGGLVRSGHRQVHRDAHPLGHAGLVGGSGEHQPARGGDSGFGDFRGVLVGRGFDEQVGDTHEPAQVCRVDDDPALQFLDRQRRVGRHQPGIAELDRVQRGFQRRLAHHGVINTTGLDLDLVVVLGHGLRDERETQDRHRRVGGQVRRAAHASGQAVFGKDRRSEVCTDGADHDSGQDRGDADHELAHPDIVAHTVRKSGSARLTGRWRAILRELSAG